MTDAKKTADNTDKKVEKSTTRRSGKLSFFAFMILGGIALPFILPTMLLVFLGMLPTIVALISDNDRQKSSAIAIGSLNCAGVTPFIIDLWLKGQTMENLFHILKEPINWLIIYAAAGIGQLIIVAIPPVLVSITTARYETRLKLLKENLENLKGTWGTEVATTKPLDKIGHKE